MIQTREQLVTSRQSCTLYIAIERKKKVKCIQVTRKLWIFPRIEKSLTQIRLIPA